MTRHELVEHLNTKCFHPETFEGKVTLSVYRDAEFQVLEGATDSELDEVGFDRGFLDAHPEGSDRGGYVPFVVLAAGDGSEVRAYHDENGGEWCLDGS